MLVVMNADDGRVIQSFPLSNGADAEVYEAKTGLVFVSTREGWIHIFHEDSPDHYSEAGETYSVARFETIRRVLETGSPEQARVSDPSAELSFSTRLRRAVEEREWTLHYQPMVSLADGEPVGVEALIRWQSPDGQLILPGVFLPLAEELGMIEAIGRWVRSEVCRQVCGWNAMGLATAASFNVSLRELQSMDLVDDLAVHGERPQALRDERARLGRVALGDDPEVVTVRDVLLFGELRRDLHEELWHELGEPGKPARHRAGKVVLGDPVRRDNGRELRAGELVVLVAGYVVDLRHRVPVLLVEQVLHR